jgi:hypothetical protein
LQAQFSPLVYTSILSLSQATHKNLALTLTPASTPLCFVPPLSLTHGVRKVLELTKYTKRKGDGYQCVRSSRLENIGSEANPTGEETDERIRGFPTKDSLPSYDFKTATKGMKSN